MIQFIITYFFSFLLSYSWMKIAYSSKGTIGGMSPDLGALMFTVLPFVNSLGIFLWIFFQPYDNLKMKEFVKKFFMLQTKIG